VNNRFLRRQNRRCPCVLTRRASWVLAEAGCNILELQSRSGHLSELQKYIDKADKRFAADRAAVKVTEHKAKQKSARKIAA
jgi:hypothetical protein